MDFFYIGCVPEESIIISATYCNTLIPFSSPNSPLFGKVTVRLKNPAKSCLSGLWPSKCILKRTKQFNSERKFEEIQQGLTTKRNLYILS